MKASRMKIINSIFKTFVLSALMIAQVHFAYGQNAAILPPAKTTFVDQNGKPLTAGKVDFYIPGTNTRKTTWQDAAATIQNTNPVILDSAGRALILGNGAYRQVVKDRNNNTIWDQVTNSAGAGGSGEITVGDGNAVGVVLPWSGFIAPSNYAFAYGQELSRTTYLAFKNAITLTQNITCISGNATLTTISDTTQLNIGAAVEAACVPAGATIISKTSSTVTISANASVSTTTSGTFFPWGNGNGITTFNAPDLRGVVLPGRNNMGGSSSSNLTTSFYTDPNAIAGSGGSQSKILLASDMPSHTHTATVTDPGHTHNVLNIGTPFAAGAGGNNVVSFANNQVTQSSTTGITVTNASTGGGTAVSATVAAGGSGYTAGTQLLTVSGGTCSVQPQFNVTIAAGAITSPVLVTAGLCSVVPSNPASTTGGGGTLGTLNVIYSANSFSLIQPSKTINYIVKISADVNLSIARCANLIDAGTACTYNVGTSGNTVPLLNTANSWSSLQTYNSGVAVSGGTTTITDLASPTNPSDAATKAYVDSVAVGLNILPQTKLATAAVLPNTPTYNNGVLGVGATLTAGANSTITVDGEVANLNDIVLVKNQASALENGIYTVTTAGSGAAAWVLTRATYFDEAAEMLAGSYTLITDGATNLSSSWTLQTTVATVGTDDLNWLQFSAASGVTSLGGQTGTITCGIGQSCTSNSIAVTPLYPYNVADIAALQALDTNGYTTAFLKESGRAGLFIWTLGDYSTAITTDTNQGIYIKATAVASTVGAWVRKFDFTNFQAKWFGAIADYSTDNTSIINSMISVGNVQNTSSTNGQQTAIFINIEGGVKFASQNIQWLSSANWVFVYLRYFSNSDTTQGAAASNSATNELQILSVNSGYPGDATGALVAEDMLSAPLHPSRGVNIHKNIDNSIYKHAGPTQWIQPTDTFSSKGTVSYVRDENVDRFRIAVEQFGVASNFNGALFYINSRSTLLACTGCNGAGAWGANIPSVGTSVVRGITTGARYLTSSLATANAIRGDWISGNAIPGEFLLNERAIFKASISGTVLTVTSMIQGATNIAVGQTLVGMFANNGITASTTISSLGTGTGGVGTYNINNSQSIDETIMVTGYVAANSIQGGGVTNTDTSATPIIISTVDRNVYFNNDRLARTKTTYANGAAGAAGSLTNAPVAGNPTKWIPVDDNGTTRYIPAW